MFQVIPGLLTKKKRVNLITNGTFDSSSNWSFYLTTFTITGGQLQCSTTTNGAAYQAISVTPGLTYEVNIELVSYTSGNPYVVIGQGTPVEFPSTALGLKTFNVVAGSTDSYFNFYPGYYGVGGTCTVDNIAVYLVG